MAGSSSKFTLETLSGQAYPIWSRKIKRQLISEGLWHLVEKGYKKPKQGEMLNDSDMHLLKQNKMNDTTALSLIHKSLSPNIFMMIIDATTAKEAWDNLHTIFRAAKISDKSDIREDDGVMPLSGDKPFFDMCLTKSAVRPLCHMNFPTRVNSILPSTNVRAKVRFFGKLYEIYFYGERKQKAFGSGWRQLVCEHNLLEGDFLVFEIMEMDDSKLEVNLQVLRNIIPPELEEEIRKRATKSKAKAIYIDDGNKE
ncbi:hypothetical protein DH2020_002619 [Rehmannia glutinosa]|uniref:TF-B3 domain-containing protein n=1 Tax=Rehmannia glutinosa TaxID=99300 RepID=A0ABR0XUN4_REHGL